jgi:hypothetical protein
VSSATMSDAIDVSASTHRCARLEVCLLSPMMCSWLVSCRVDRLIGSPAMTGGGRERNR